MEAPKIPSIFKSPSAKEFKYRPFYYNPEKEERERRNKWIKKEAEDEVKSGKSAAFQSRLRERWELSNHASKRANSSNLRLIIIILVLLGISYFLLK